MMRLGAILLCIAAVIAFLLSPVFDISRVEVTGNSYYSDEEVVNMSGVQKGVNLFLHPQKRQIKAALETNPYFSKIKVHRRLPSTLRIDVTERKQVAAVKYGNSYVVISGSGLVLRTTKIDPKLTILTGLTLSRIRVGRKITAVEKQTLEKTLEMVNVMDRGDLYFKKIKMSDRYIDAYDTLIVRGTPSQMKEEIEKGNLQKVVNKLYKNGTRRGTISLGDHNYISFSPAF